jgi:PAS domain S-box-containing protein
VTDYLQKSSGTEQYELLAHRITNAVSQLQAEQRLQEEQQRVQEEQQRLRTLFDCLSQPTVEVQFQNDEPIVTQINSAFEDVFGYESESIVGNSLDTHIVPDDRIDEAKAINQHIRADGRLESREVLRETADGLRQFLFQHAVCDDGLGGFGIYTDVTDRREREETLERNRDILRHTERLATVGGWEADIETGEISWTQGTYAIHNLDPAGEFEPSIETGLELYHPDDRATVQQAVEKCRTQGKAYKVDVRLVTAEDEQKWVRTTGEPVHNDDEIVKIRGAICDITQHVEDRQKLQRQNEQLDEFASVVSHDLRNPLSVAEGYLEFLREDCESGRIDKIDSALARMDELIEDLLTLARAGEQIGSVESVNLAELSQNCWQNVETTDATIHLDISTTQGITLKADSNRLAQLLENLMRNAIEHARTQGKNKTEDEDVTITVGELADGFYVADDGNGIPESEQDDVFEAGYTTTEQGTGFGLSIVKQVVEAHGWEISITESAEGGARFEVTHVDVSRIESNQIQLE